MNPQEKQAHFDPDDWDEIEAIWRRAVTAGIEHLKRVRETPVWRPTPMAVREALQAPLPIESTPFPQIVHQFFDDLLPYNNGNTHPAFYGWVHGGGNVYGAIGEMCAAIMNSNVGGRDHIAVYVERQIHQWCRTLFGFPQESSGLLTTGTSMATLIALTVARNSACGIDINEHGLQALERPLIGYCSEQTHSSVLKAFQMLGLGGRALRSVPVGSDFTMDCTALAQMIQADRARGAQPFCVVATAGTVNTGAIDDIASIAALCESESLWLHVDAAFGGFAILLDEYKKRLSPIACADSVAFDFHKWPQVPYSVGALLVRDAEAHRNAFSARKEYLTAAEQGLAGGAPWFCDFGPELSRSALAIKVWFTLKTLGIRRLSAVVRKHCEQAAYLANRISDCLELELMAPVILNVVCFRFRAAGKQTSNDLNNKIVTRLQVSGKAAPSTTTLEGHLVIRVALVNHRTCTPDLDALIEHVLATGRQLTC